MAGETDFKEIIFEVFNDELDCLDVCSQNAISLPFDAHLVDLTGVSSLLTAQADPGDTELTLTDSTGFIDGTVIGVNSGTGEFYFGAQVGAPVGNVITVDSPIDGVFPIGSNILVLEKNMAVDGSVTTRVFRFGPGSADISIDVHRFAMYIQDGTAMDDSRFGGIVGGLTYGVALRTNKAGVFSNLWNAKTNGDLALISASDLDYTPNAPAGSYGARVRNSYNGDDKHGVAIRLGFGDFVEVLVQDNLTDLEVFHIMAQGHLV